MITNREIAQWATTHPWQSADQVEQDLLLSQAICEIAENQLLSEELVMRGGTAYHKIVLPEPLRYSEDLDYVRIKGGGIGGVLNELTAIGKSLGYRVNTQIGKYPKVVWRFEYASGAPGKIKIEINTYERSPMLPLKNTEYKVDSPYYAKTAMVHIFQTEELVATKLRALYQRSKGRDLFDLWLGLTVLNLNPEDIIAAFPAYRPEGITKDLMITNLENKLKVKRFCHDIDNLVRIDTPEYDAVKAAELVIDKLINKI